MFGGRTVFEGGAIKVLEDEDSEQDEAEAPSEENVAEARYLRVDTVIDTVIDNVIDNVIDTVIDNVIGTLFCTFP